MKCLYCGTEPNNATTIKNLYECELEGFDLHLQWGEYDDSEIRIKMPKGVTQNGSI